jgi:hypothetical protein
VANRTRRRRSQYCEAQEEPEGSQSGEAQGVCQQLRQAHRGNAEEVATELHMNLEEVRQVFRHSSKFKKQVRWNEFNAKVWWRKKEMNEGKSDS